MARRDSAAAGRADRAAARAARSPGFELVARFGYVASGLTHVLVGFIALRIAGGGAGVASTSGAVSELAEGPGGTLLIAAGAAGCAAMALFQLARLVVAGDTMRGWQLVKDRVSDAGQVVVYAAVGAIFASFLLGTGHADGSSGWTARLLAVPGGQLVLAGVGAGVLGGGLWFLWVGLSRRFRRQLVRLRHAGLERAMELVGLLGYLAKGISLGIIGLLTLTAAVAADPAQPVSLDAALRTLRDQPFGAALLTAVGFGLIAYGLYIGMIRALFQRL